mmetsp:Transcript_23093/g.39065  ORF Transcript_23093/g.39065 Transcript_23093/m.39065 type:complete len:278 (+) Transcript_23093:1896-2729(+)
MFGLPGRRGRLLSVLVHLLHANDILVVTLQAIHLDNARIHYRRQAHISRFLLVQGAGAGPDLVQLVQRRVIIAGSAGSVTQLSFGDSRAIRKRVFPFEVRTAAPKLRGDLVVVDVLAQHIEVVLAHNLNLVGGYGVYQRPHHGPDGREKPGRIDHVQVLEALRVEVCVDLQVDAEGAKSLSVQAIAQPLQVHDADHLVHTLASLSRRVFTPHSHQLLHPHMLHRELVHGEVRRQLGESGGNQPCFFPVDGASFLIPAQVAVWANSIAHILHGIWLIN